MFWWSFSSNIFAYLQQSKYFNFDVNFQNIYWKSTPSGRKVHINYWVYVFVAQEKSDYPCRQERIQWKHNFTKYLLLMIFVTMWNIVSKHRLYIPKSAWSNLKIGWISFFFLWPCSIVGVNVLHLNFYPPLSFFSVQTVACHNSQQHIFISLFLFRIV